MSTINKHPNTHSNKLKAAALMVLLLAIAAAAFVYLRGCEASAETAVLEAAKPDETAAETAAEPFPGLTYDESAVSGGWDEADTEAIVDSLNHQVEDGMINISMNTSPIYATGTSEGNLMIVNEEINRYPQVVEIARNDTGELLYTSGAIPVGSKIENAKLDVPLSAGGYDCTALFYNVDPESGTRLGCAGAVITISVLD